MSRRTVLVHAGICDASMWDGFDLPGEVVAHQLPAPLADHDFSDAATRMPG